MRSIIQFGMEEAKVKARGWRRGRKKRGRQDVTGGWGGGGEEKKK